ncbi:DNA/RNA non-specific endonuclease [Nocardiopsis sp. N85]|uniref:DNA/RNA non-specific endonuclease n=1 Tax=Nocardiopsis sp. N85 TaxID=3029400 RepID=UPI00237FD5B5|nr:DNA/RNA non-specific endonuclease [Nocardiopsis sp. N85]MDE3723917.1 DNA/RNA non-specific endonuclease [Nocardiopsis sp. N85]
MSDLIDPSNFPVPKTLTYALDAVAAKLKTDGTDLTDTAGDITGAWAGLDGIYSAPEDETLFNVLKPITGDAGDVSSALSSTSNALSDFAEKVRDIKGRWATLRTDSNEFLRKIDNGDKEGWRDGGGFLWWKSESAEVGEHNELLNRAAGLLHEFQEAERTCANAITGLFGGTTFIAQNSEGSVKPGSKEFVYGFDKPLEGVPMEWGAPQTTDHAWYNDFGDAVGDFFVGIAEDAGGMVGAHGPNGWFSGNWGDNLWDYWGGTVEGLAGLAGVGKDENGDWGFSWSTMGNSWKEAAHAVVPWEEWGERPWYTIGTALLNVGAVVGGALLTATGVGAVVGVPLMAWRGAKIVNSVGGSRTPDVPDAADLPGGIDPALLARVPRFGDGSITPVDLGSVADLDIDGADLGRMNEALERLNASTNNNGNGQGSGTPGGTDGRRAPVTADAPDTPGDTSSPRATTTRTESTPEGTERRRTDTADDRDGTDTDTEREPVHPTTEQLDASQDFLDGIDPESRRSLGEGLNGEQDRWVAGQTVPDDISSVNDTPVQRYESEPSRVEADVEQRVEVDSAGNEINGHNDTTVNNSVGGTDGLDTPRGGTTVVDVDSGSGRGGTGGGGGGSHSSEGSLPVRGGGGNGGNGGGGSGGGGDVPNTPDGDRTRPGGRDNPHVIRPNDPDSRFTDLMPGPKERFGDGVDLDPDTTYRIENSDGHWRGTYTTDADGNVTRVETVPDRAGSKNPEFLDPRPDTTYVVRDPDKIVDVTNPDGTVSQRPYEYSYTTDSGGRTTSVEGDLISDRHPRNVDEQDAVNKSAKDYFAALNEQLEANGSGYQYANGRWNGGHLIGANEFGGVGERLNQIPMLEVVNQRRNAFPGIEGSFRNMEKTWDNLLNGNWSELRKVEKREGVPAANWDAAITEWQKIIRNGPQPPNIHVRITTMDHPDLKPIDVLDDNGNVVDVLRPPPGEVIVEWSLNGIEQERRSYHNIPDTVPTPPSGS